MAHIRDIVDTLTTRVDVASLRAPPELAESTHFLARAGYWNEGGLPERRQ